MQQKNFNSSVYWRTIQDTTYTPKEEAYLIRSDNIVREIYSSTPQISSLNALNGNKTIKLLILFYLKIQYPGAFTSGRVMRELLNMRILKINSH